MIYFGSPTAALCVHLYVLTCGPPSNHKVFFSPAIFTVALLFDISRGTKSRSFHFFWPVLIVFCRICPYLHRTISKFPKWAIFKFMKHELAIAPVTPIIYTAQVFFFFLFSFFSLSGHGGFARRALVAWNGDFFSRRFQINFLCWMGTDSRDTPDKWVLCVWDASGRR